MLKTERLLSIRYDQTEYPELARQQDTLKKRGKFRQWVLDGLTQFASSPPPVSFSAAMTPDIYAFAQEMLQTLKEIEKAVKRGSFSEVQDTIAQAKTNGVLSEDIEGEEFQA
jgi:hypothetical protein